jgi:hypothetical protein
MAVTTMARDSWTDERLDDLNHRVDEGFTEMRAEFRSVRGEMAAMQRMIFQMFVTVWVTSLVGFLGVIATILAQG